MKEKLERYQVIVYLILIILIMTVVKIKYGNNTEDTQISNVSSQNKTEITTTPTAEINKDYPLKDKLPYQGKGYVIEKYMAPMTLNLKLTTATQQQAAKDISVWLNSFGEAGSGHILEMEVATDSATSPTATVSAKKVATPTAKLKITN